MLATWRTYLVLRETPKNATRTSAIYWFCFTKFMREMLRSLSKKVVKLLNNNINGKYELTVDKKDINPFYPEYDSSRSLHLTRLPRTLTFWNPIGWLTPNDVSISGSLGNPYFSTNQCRSLGICSTKRVPPS